MTTHTRIFRFNRFILAAALLAGTTAVAQAEPDAQIVEALKLKPRQTDVNFEKVDLTDVEACHKQLEKRSNAQGIFITGPNGQPLRWFADSNGDRSIDLWSYYNNGVEVYRDLDTDFDGKVNESRWFGTAGTRWGVDADQDGTIDSWKQISAEEVTMEVVAAIRDRDAKRFQRVLLTKDELSSLGLGSDKVTELTKRLATAADSFADFASSQKSIDANAKWSNFGADKPGVVPAGTDGSSNDIVAYENVMAIVEKDSKPEQLLIGSLIQTGVNQWRATDLPKLVDNELVLTSSSTFFNGNLNARMAQQAATGGLSVALQDLLKELEEVETAIDSTTDVAEKDKLNAKRADVLAGLVAESKSMEDKQTWVHQFTDTISAVTQTGEYTGGLQRLVAFKDAAKEVSDEAEAYVAFRIVQTEYASELNEGNTADFPKVQENYLKQLEEFVSTYPDSQDTAEAMVQLGLNSELAADIETATKWYKQTADKFTKTPAGQKAAGAIARLNLNGRSLDFTGKTIDGKNFDSKALRGAPYVVHYWATWCEPCKNDMQELRRLQAKFAKSKVNIVGINLDNKGEDARTFLAKRENDFPWIHLYDEGAFDSKMAVGLGVFSLPVTIVIGPDGKVLGTSTHYSSEIEALIEESLKAKK